MQLHILLSMIMNVKKALVIIVLTTVAVVATIIMPYVLVFFVPSIMVVDDGGKAPIIQKNSAFTMEELEQARREADERINRREAPEVERKKISSLLRDSFWWCTWLPWLFPPLFVRRRLEVIDFLVGMVPLLVVGFIGWIKPIEMIFSGTSLLMAMLFIKPTKSTGVKFLP